MPQHLVNLLVIALFAIQILLWGCGKSSNTEQRPPYLVTINNELTLLDAKFGVFINNQAGEVESFQWLTGHAVQDVGLQFSDSETYDLTIVKITYSQDLPGYPEELVELTSYKDVRHKTIINLRNLKFEEESDVKLQFSNLASLDSLVVPEGTTLITPEASNNFFGSFRISHTGDFWLFGKFNGQSDWRYFTFKDFAPTASTFNINANLLAPITQNAPKVQLPFEARWRYQLDGILDVDNNRIITLGDIMALPEESVGLSKQLEVFKPEDLFINGYKVELEGTKGGPDGYTYRINRFYGILPSTIDAPNFDISPTLINDNRNLGVACTGDFDGLVATRTIGGTPAIKWESYLPPLSNGLVTYKLPDLPEELKALYPKLGNYAFDGGVKVRAERYKLLFGFEDLLLTKFENSDAFWQPKNELLSIEKTFN